MMVLKITNEKSAECSNASSRSCRHDQTRIEMHMFPAQGPNHLQVETAGQLGSKSLASEGNNMNLNVMRIGQGEKLCCSLPSWTESQWPVTSSEPVPVATWAETHKGGPPRTDPIYGLGDTQ